MTTGSPGAESGLVAIRRVAGFGAAMAALAIPHSAEAAVVDLSGNLPITPLAFGAHTAFNLFGGPSSSFFQYNGFYSTIFQTYFDGLAAIGPFLTQIGYLGGPGSPAGSITIGATTNFYSTTFGIGYGVMTFGFKTALNQPGWIRMDFGTNVDSPVIYLAAAYEDTPDGSIHIPAQDVPGPSLALGALASLAQAGRIRRRIRRGTAGRAGDPPR